MEGVEGIATRQGNLNIILERGNDEKRKGASCHVAGNIFKT